MKKIFLAASLFSVALLQAQFTAAQSASVTLNLRDSSHAIPPKLYGLMTEEINFSYDGGLYAELIRNRNFTEFTRPAGNNGPVDVNRPPDHWSVVLDDSTQGSILPDKLHPLSAALPSSLQLQVVHAGRRTGIANDGYWGIPVLPNTHYNASFYVKGTTPATFTVSIESKDGKTIYAKAQTTAVTNDWKQYKVELVSPDGIRPTANTRFVIATADTGTYWFSLVSLFPPTYHNTVNGSRTDIMQLLADMKPGFLRFPGGNYLEGDYFSTRFDWKKTIGKLENRPGHPSPWGYRSTDGLGLLEFLRWCEDLKMEPLLAVFAGYTLKGDYFSEPEFLQPFINEALEEIEYVTGDASTHWGAVRAADGHPAPFPLTYIEIGNEDGFDRSGSYEKRYNQFAAAIRAKYPQLKLISTTGGKTDFLSLRYPMPAAKADLVDEHFYRNAMEMEEMASLYDSYDRKGPKIFVGEWATREGDPTTNFNSALGDAAFLTGLERNSDLVEMHCFAPLFVNVNPGGMQWKSDLIGYNALTSYGSPAYHVQKMFNQHLGDRNVVVETSHLPEQIKTPNARDSARGVQPKKIPAMFFSASRDSKKHVLYLKVVNATAMVQPLTINLAGQAKVMSTGGLLTLKAGKTTDTNTIDNPNNIVPVATNIKGIKNKFIQQIPAYSISVMSIQLQ